MTFETRSIPALLALGLFALLAGACSESSAPPPDAAAGGDAATACAPAGTYTFEAPVGDPSNPATCPAPDASPLSIGADGLPTTSLCSASCTCEVTSASSTCESSVHLTACGGSAYASYDLAFDGDELRVSVEGTISSGDVCRFVLVGRR